MKEVLEKLPEEIRELICLAGEVSDKLGVKAYLVGGFVRDILLGVNNFDVDITVEGDGILFAESLAERLDAHLLTHKRFGTATLILKHHAKIDIASTRKEYYPEPASLPVVSRGSLVDDLARRDFTINALAICITGHEFGRMVDTFCGKKDLAGRKIRILHEASFIDDPTRILRAIRFEKRFNFKIEPSTLKLLKDSCRHKMVERVQPQRIRDELILILKEKKPSKHIVRIQELLGLRFIHPKLRFSRKQAVFFEALDKEIDFFKHAHHQHRHLDTWLVYGMGLLESLGLRETRDVCEKFVFRKADQLRIISYKRIAREFFTALNKHRVAPSVIVKMLEPLSFEAMILLKAKYQHKALPQHIDTFLHVHHGVRVEITGHDLKTLGIPPGPSYQKIFQVIRCAKLDGKITTREEELALASRLAKAHNHDHRHT